MAKNRIKLLAALVAAGMSLAACGSADESTSTNQSSGDSISIEDNSGELPVSYTHLTLPTNREV